MAQHAAAAKQRPDAHEDYYVASQWRLMWWKFTRHKPAVASGLLIVLLYLLGVFCEFVSPYDPEARHIKYVFAPPQRIHFFDSRGFHLRPFVYDMKSAIDRETLRKTFREDPSRQFRVRLLARGEKYKLWGLWGGDVHLFGVEGEGTLFVLGTDRMGRDVLSRVLYGARVSLSIGLIGVLLSLLMGLILGGVSGYYGGAADVVIQRLIELLRSFPSIPLWMALSAALPPHWSPLKVYFGITIILSFVGWTGLARVVRGKLLSLREEEFALAALISGASEMTVIVKHLLPSFLSHIIVSITLSIPQMILAETALSFLGVGLRPPVTSWGVLLQEAQNVRTVALYPWLLLPVLFVIVAVLAFNFLGDGLRDAADPYSR